MRDRDDDLTEHRGNDGGMTGDSKRNTDEKRSGSVAPQSKQQAITKVGARPFKSRAFKLRRICAARFATGVTQP